jgi:hypothetical protein
MKLSQFPVYLAYPVDVIFYKKAHTCSSLELMVTSTQYFPSRHQL